jgi:hypothetical protein
VLTCDAREQTAQRLAESLYSLGYTITSANELKPKHVQAYISERFNQDQIGVRTAQNELAHIRGILEEAGKGGMANSGRMSNERIIGERAERTPARVAPSADERAKIIDAATERDAGVGAALKLQEALGLRPREAVRSAQSLATWQCQLERGQRVTIAYGTKGGKPRDTAPHDRQAALNAVREARQVTAVRNGRLVQSRSGTLKAAMMRYNRIAHQAGARGVHAPHSFRYAFAQERMRAYQKRGFSRQEARSLTGQDLGHGDTRGRWIASVYGESA